MLRPRLIPCLLVYDGALVKTVRFASPTYVGDPINAVRIFNEKEVDELVLLDIGATIGQRAPIFSLIKAVAAECRMPFCYGGGIRSVDQIEALIGFGVEKVALGAAAVEDPDLIEQAATRVGSQSIVAVIDARKAAQRGYSVFTRGGKHAAGIDPASLARRMEECGAGEILLQSIDNDGMMQGYDMDLIASVRAATRRPLTVLGGAGSLDDIRHLFGVYKTIGAAAGSLFVFKGKFRAVLINYPDRTVKDSLTPG